MRAARKLLAATLGFALALGGLVAVDATVAPVQGASADGVGQPFSCAAPTYFAMVGAAASSTLYTGTFATATGGGVWTALPTVQSTAATTYNALGFNPAAGSVY